MQAKHQDVAKLIRKDLKAIFPGVKFSVTCGRGSVYGTIYVNWDRETGIKRAQVEEAIGKYQTYSGWCPLSDISHHENRLADVPQVSQIWFQHS